MLTHETVLNLYSNARLSGATLDFLEGIKFQPHDLIDNEKFQIINHVNSDKKLLKQIFNANLEVGFCETVDIKKSKETNASYDSFLAINKKRKSIRKYSQKPLIFEELCSFLNLFYSITGNEDINFHGEILNRKIRNIASGGSLYPTEIYIINNRIEDIKKGAYRYNVINAQLELLVEFDTDKVRKDFLSIIMHDEIRKSNIDFDNASAFILFSSVLNRVSSKYQDFGVALSLIEVGQFIHSAYLSAAALDLGCCPFGGILNDKMREFLNIDNFLHYPVLCMSLGNKNNLT